MEQNKKLRALLSVPWLVPALLLLRVSLSTLLLRLYQSYRCW